MHRLDKTTVPTPACCQLATEGRRYRDLHGHEKEEIRTKLLALQKNRCAYCERRTGDGRDDGHIEHFRKQADPRNRHLELEWSNLYWSCNDEKSCGKHKDKCDRSGGPLAQFDPDHIIDPGRDDPEQFFLFVVDGTVRPAEHLDPEQLWRAEETLRVFQLADCVYLRRSREDAIRPYLGAIAGLLSAGPEWVVRYVQDEISRADDAPFGTAIRQYLRGFLA